MPKRKKRRISEDKVQNAMKNQQTKNKIIKRDGSRRRRVKRVDVDSMAKSIYKEVILTLGIDHLNLDEKIQLEIAKEIISLITSMSRSYTSKSAILHRVSRLKERLGPVISSVILANKNKLTEEELEYIVYYGGRAILSRIGELYEMCKSYGRDDLVSLLRELWDKEGHPLPIRCPYCGFSSITPAFECIVCGRIVDEAIVKEQIGFSDLFEIFLSIADVDALRKVSEDKAIAYNPKYGLRPISRRLTDSYEYILPLNEEELYKLKLKLLAKSLI